MVPSKNRKKKWVHFLKLDILKMSKIQNAIIKFYKKNEKSIFTRRCFKYQKNTPKFVTIIFFMKKQRDFSVSKKRKQINPKILQILLKYLLLKMNIIIK